MIKCVYTILLLLLLCQCTPDDRRGDVNASKAKAGITQAVKDADRVIEKAIISDPVITIRNAFVKPTLPRQKKAIAYLVIHNLSDVKHTLSHVHSNIAEHVQIEREYYEHGALSIKPVELLVIDPNSKLQFKPRGYRLVLSGLERELKAKESFEIIFEFEQGLRINAQVIVKPFV